MPKLPGGAAAGAPNGVVVRASAACSAAASVAGVPRPAMCMYITRGDSCCRWLCSAVCSIRSEEHTSELQSRLHLVCRLLLEKKKKKKKIRRYENHDDIHASSR